MPDRDSPLRLTDDQMRQYIVNGYLVFKPDLPDGLHENIRQKIAYVLDNEYNPGNNILPRVPDMHHVLDSPEVRGALISVLGENYLELPHRYCHPMGRAKNGDRPTRTVAEASHQDSYTVLSRPRQHYSRFARIMYYPQDTPVERGPTHAIPGTQYHSRLTDEDRARNVPMAGKAGTVSITHFDVGHAAGINLTDQARYMIKFIYARAAEPVAPTWNHDPANARETGNWQTPVDHCVPNDLEVAWSHFWDWMCGKTDRYDSFRACRSGGTNGQRSTWIANLGADKDLSTRLQAAHALAAGGEAASDAIPALAAMLNREPQAGRIAAIYALGAIGEPAVEPLMAMLRQSRQSEDEQTEQPGWNENATIMDDAAHALAAVGGPAVPALGNALNDPDEWIRVNAAFALGQMDCGALDTVPALTHLLDDPSHRVVRTVADTLGNLGSAARVCIPTMGRLLTARRPGWDKPQRHEYWTAADQVHSNTAMSLARFSAASPETQDLLIQSLDHDCGHVGAFAFQGLQRRGTPLAIEAVLKYLSARRWDAQINREVQF